MGSARRRTRKGGVIHSIRYLLYDELNVKRDIQEWDNQEVRVSLEQDAWWTGEKLIFMSGIQKKLRLVSLIGC